MNIARAIGDSLRDRSESFVGLIEAKERQPLGHICRCAKFIGIAGARGELKGLVVARSSTKRLSPIILL